MSTRTILGNAHSKALVTLFLLFVVSCDQTSPHKPPEKLDNGYADLAFEVASRETYPSWGWWIVNGATTFYENWSIDASRDFSRNHIGFGEINAWFYKALGGIFPDERSPGFKHVMLKPNFVSGLQHFKASHEGPYGVIESSWKRSSEGIDYHVVIPPNSAATVTVKAAEILDGGEKIGDSQHITIMENGPGSLSVELTSGVYDFLIKP